MKHNRRTFLKKAKAGVTATGLSVLVLFCILSSTGCQRESHPALAGFAQLPADSFALGPTSGQFIVPVNRRTPPFVDKQPIQGFSALITDGDGTLLAMTDNGFGTKENSPDFIPGVYRIRPTFKTKDGGSGQILVQSFFPLHDPDNKIDFTLTADLEFYPGSDDIIPVDKSIQMTRTLTGWDVDIESFQRVPDGTFYFGDEFGPFIIHTDSSGKILEAPIPLPGVKSPQNPYLRDEESNLPRSGGFEGMALNKSGTKLYPVLEKPLKNQPDQLNIYEYDLITKNYSHSDPYQPPYRYKLENDAISVCEMTAISDEDYLVIERDGYEGPLAVLKKVFHINLDKIDEDGFLIKNEIIDLLNLKDENNLGGSDIGKFRFPFETIEALVIIDDLTVCVVNDNNFPFSVGRFATTTREPDDNEFILVRLKSSLRSLI
ncbi:esterase-like activity of phytase family protein [Acidobacteriota bacterium]